jgi:hypothetical protein
MCGLSGHVACCVWWDCGVFLSIDSTTTHSTHRLPMFMMDSFDSILDFCIIYLFCRALFSRCSYFTMAGNSSSASSWRTPSAANQAKFHLVALPEEFEPTEEEKGLLSMYETLRNYEREAARLRDRTNREKLAAKEAEFKQSLAPKRKIRRKREKMEGVTGAGDDEDEGSDEDDESEEETDDIQERRAAKLEALRDEVEDKKKAMAVDENKEEDLREHFLAQNEDVDLGPTLKRKKLNEPAEGKTLLSSMMKMKTPPHEFSEKLGIKPWKGKVLFPTSIEEPRWTPPQSAQDPNDGAFLVELEEFDISKAQTGIGNNTIIVKLNAPSDSKRFRYVLLAAFC